MDKEADKGIVADCLKLSGKALKEKIHLTEEILKSSVRSRLNHAS
jgi:hypothetical protein